MQERFMREGLQHEFKWARDDGLFLPQLMLLADGLLGMDSSDLSTPTNAKPVSATHPTTQAGGQSLRLLTIITCGSFLRKR